MFRLPSSAAILESTISVDLFMMGGIISSFVLSIGSNEARNALLGDTFHPSAAPVIIGGLVATLSHHSSGTARVDGEGIDMRGLSRCHRRGRVGRAHGAVRSR